MQSRDQDRYKAKNETRAEADAWRVPVFSPESILPCYRKILNYQIQPAEQDIKGGESHWCVLVWERQPQVNCTRWANLWHLNNSSVDLLQKLLCEWLRASSPGGKPPGSAPEVRKWPSIGCLSQYQQVSQDSAVCWSHSQFTIKCCINTCLRSTDIFCQWTDLDSSAIVCLCKKRWAMPELHNTHGWPFKKNTTYCAVIISVQLKEEINDIAVFVVSVVQILFH